jgi:hypothetical protein
MQGIAEQVRMKRIAVGLLCLLLSLVSVRAIAHQDIEASLVRVEYQLRAGDIVRVRVDKKRVLESVSIESGQARTTVTRSDFGKIKRVVLNAVKIYEAARLRDDLTFDHYVYLRIPYARSRKSLCYWKQDSSFPHDCDVVTLFFANGKLSSVKHRRAIQEG